MTLAYYFDEHVPWAITHGVRTAGIEVLRVQDDSLRGVEDEPLLQRATDLGRVLFTQDDDFLAISAEWLRTGRTFPGIVYVHQDRLSYRERIAELIRLSREFSAEQMVNQVVYLPLRLPPRSEPVESRE